MRLWLLLVLVLSGCASSQVERHLTDYESELTACARLRDVTAYRLCLAAVEAKYASCWYRWIEHGDDSACEQVSPSGGS